MRKFNSLASIWNAGLLFLIVGLWIPQRTAYAEEYKSPPGSYRTSWVGNSFGGDGGPNGTGYWIQNGADEIEVTPDGTVIAGTDWDEAGRCVGLYKDGKCNRVLVKQERAKETAWGWNTGNNAIAVNGTNIFIGNTGKRLLRCSWTPGDLDSVKVVEDISLPEKPVGLASRGTDIAVVYSNLVELRLVSDLKKTGAFGIPDLRDATFASDGSLWVIAGKTVRHVQRDGKEISSGLEGLDVPTALGFDYKSRLIVCDDGPDQQVKFYDVSGDHPRLEAVFGEKGGVRAGVPGEYAPQKLYSPRGAGTDTNGNLYVALGFNGAPVGTLVLRSFTPQGQLRWELMNHAFVDTYGFDPDSDGGVVYSRTAVFDLDLAKEKPGSEWHWRATTIDHITHPDDPRAKTAATACLRRLGGRRVLYTIGQYGGGYHLFTFDEPSGFIAHPAGEVTGKGETWAWDIDRSGNIWHGDAEGKTIRRFRFEGWKNGKPSYDLTHYDSWPWPEDFELVRRVIYDEGSDALYISGYLKNQKIDSWGVVGWTLRRYNGWVSGKRQNCWTNIQLPQNPDSEGPGKPLSPESIAVAGDFIFVGMVKPDNGKQRVHILNTADGQYVGSFAPGLEVGGSAGWEDMPYAVQAIKRKNGEYLVLVEEDWRGKNLLYRWKPSN